MPIITTNKDEAYYKAALELLRKFNVEGIEDKKTVQPGKNANQIRWLRSLCYSCLGDLNISYNQRSAAINFIKALVEKRLMRTG
jgi:hypothetical protein